MVPEDIKSVDFIADVAILNNKWKKVRFNISIVIQLS